MIRSRLFYAALAAAVALAYVQAASTTAPGCTTDSECAAYCPAGTMDLPPDHPDYCDGGPDPVDIIGVRG